MNNACPHGIPILIEFSLFQRIYEKLEQIEEHLSRILSFEEKLEKIVNITEFLREHGPGNIAFERTCSTKEKKFKSSRSDTNHQTYEKYRQCVPGKTDLQIVVQYHLN